MELWGAKISITPDQANLFTSKPLEIEAVHFHEARIIRLKEDEALRLSFIVVLAGVPPEELLNYIEGIKRGTVKIVIDPGSEASHRKGKERAIQLGLVPKKAKDSDEEEESDEESGEGNEAGEEDSGNEEGGTEEDAAAVASETTLASVRAFHDKTPGRAGKKGLVQ
jgi:hypothetical protein